MSVVLSQIVPWGRSLEEYRLMFNLSEDELDGYILGCGDGTASFNYEMTSLGYRVISFDPIYVFSKEQIRKQIEDTYETIISQVKRNPHNYVWHYHHNPDILGSHRLAAMEKFLADYDVGCSEYRYQQQALPSLSFSDNQFDLALCSHLLFLYSEQLSLNFHLTSLRELCRVASEVRVFPLLRLDCKISPYVEPILNYFSDDTEFSVEVRTVPYEFQRGGNKMMQICRKKTYTQEVQL